MSSDQVRHRYLLLTAARWLPTGLVIPVMVLLLVDRGLSLTQVGLVVTAQMAMVMLLELPTGGLADTVGRRRVLVVATVFDLAALALLIVADTLPLLGLVFALQGVFRALDSGPLDAWYVDAAQEDDPGADIESTLAAGGVALGLSLTVGTAIAAGVVALDGWPLRGLGEPLVVPLVIAVVLRLANLAAIAGLMDRGAVGRGAAGLRWSALSATIREAVVIVRSSRVLLALLVVEVLWGAGMVSFETHTPVRLAEVLGSEQLAATVFGPATAAGWLASAAAAGLTPALSRRLGPARAAALLRLAQGLTVAGIAVFAGPVGVVLAFVATMAVHGSANAIHSGLLHRAVSGADNRATVVSVNSLAAQVGGAVGIVSLGALADAAGLTTSMLVGATLLAAGAPWYLRARGSNPPARPGRSARLSAAASAASDEQQERPHGANPDTGGPVHVRLVDGGMASPGPVR